MSGLDTTPETASAAPAAVAPAAPAGLTVRGLRSLLGDSLVYGASISALPVMLVLVTPILTRRLQPAGFGTVDVLAGLVSLASLVTMLGMDNAVARSYFDYGFAEERQLVIRTALVLVFVVSCAAALAVAGGFGLLRLVTRGHAFGTVVSVAAAFATMPLANAQAISRLALLLPRRRSCYLVAALLQALVSGGAAVGLVLAGIGPAGYFAGLALGSLAALTFTVPTGRFVTRGAAWLDRTELRQMIAYGLPLVPAAVAVWVVFAVDRALVASIRGFSAAGLYGLGAKVTSPMMLATSAFAVAWGPFILGQSTERQRELRARALTAVVAGTGAIMLVVVVFAPQLVRLLGGPRFHASTRAVPGVALGWLGWAAATVLATEFAISRRTRVIGLATAGTAVVNVLLNLALIPPFGFVASAWTTAGSFFLLAAVYWIVEGRSGRAPYRYGRLAAVTATLGAGALAVLLPGTSGGLAAKAAVCAVTVVGLAALAATDRERPRESPEALPRGAGS